MKLSRLHEEFLEKARRPMEFGRLPVQPKETDVPIVVVNRWTKDDSCLKKTFIFMILKQRNDFLNQVMDHEEEVGHYSEIIIKKENVTVKLKTPGVDRITELDKEFSKWIDELYKDIVYSTSHV